MTDKALNAVLLDLARVVQGITSEQQKLPTPCEGMDVRALRRHLLGWLHLFDAALADPAGQQRPEPAEHPEPESGRTAAADIDHLVATVNTAVAIGVEEAMVNVPQLGGTHPGSAVLDMLTIEALGHGWDLARATDQDWQPAPATCDRALAALHHIVLPEYRGDGMPFGPEVPAAKDAPPLDRFLAFTGRDPRWTPQRTMTTVDPG